LRLRDIPYPQGLEAGQSPGIRKSQENDECCD
jgi:hypothetical protein